jgi:hypothetical protein
LAEIFMLRLEAAARVAKEADTAGRQGVVGRRLAPNLQNLLLEGVCHGYDVLLGGLRRRSQN